MMKWTKKLLLERGVLNWKMVLKCILDLDARLRALEEDSSETPTATRDLSFTINDGTAPIKGATVKIGSKTGTTGDAGGCTLKDIEDGSQSVEVSATGYTTKTETITVDSTHTSFTISLTSE